MILKLLKLDDWQNLSENVDIAKGKYKLPTTLKEGLKNYKRWKK